MKRDELKKIFGEQVISKLFSFVKNDTIKKSNLKNMAVEMGVIQTYNAYKDRDPFDPMETFNNMLVEERLKCWSLTSFLRKPISSKSYY